MPVYIDLRIIKRVWVKELSGPRTLTTEAMLEEFKDVFTGVGQFKKEYNIEVERDVPVFDYDWYNKYNLM